MLRLKINKSGIIKIKLNNISSKIRYKPSCLKLKITDFKLQQHNFNAAQYDLNLIQYNLNSAQYNLNLVQHNLNMVQRNLNSVQHNFKSVQCNLNLVQYNFKSVQRKNASQLFIIFKDDYYFAKN